MSDELTTKRALFALAKVHHFDSKGMSLAEGVLHELAHSVVIDPRALPSSSSIVLRFADMPSARQDAEEQFTCAVEFLASRRLGFRFSLGRLAAYAASMMEQARFKTPANNERAIRRRLKSWRARRLANVLVSIVCGEGASALVRLTANE